MITRGTEGPGIGIWGFLSNAAHTGDPESDLAGSVGVRKQFVHLLLYYNNFT